MVIAFFLLIFTVETMPVIIRLLFGNGCYESLVFDSKKESDSAIQRRELQRNAEIEKDKAHQLIKDYILQSMEKPVKKHVDLMMETWGDTAVGYKKYFQSFLKYLNLRIYEFDDEMNDNNEYAKKNNRISFLDEFIMVVKNPKLLLTPTIVLAVICICFSVFYGYNYCSENHFEKAVTIASALFAIAHILVIKANPKIQKLTYKEN